MRIFLGRSKEGGEIGGRGGKGRDVKMFNIREEKMEDKIRGGGGDGKAMNRGWGEEQEIIRMYRRRKCSVLE